MIKWLIFTDLDGTLLDHGDYNYEPALPVLQRIDRLQIPLIINSSKTYAEIDALRKQLHNNGAFVVENGAAVFFPGGLFPGFERSLNRVILGRPIEEILDCVHRLRERHRFSFRGFSDFSVDEVMRETGLPQTEAIQAKQRLATEPLKWQDSDEKRRQFARLLEEHGLQLIKGGRFWHVMGRHDKSGAMVWLLSNYQQQQARKIVTIALGDSENDRKMLEEADYAAVIKRKDGSYLDLKKPEDKRVLSQNPAPLGWREAMELLFVKLKVGGMNE